MNRFLLTVLVLLSFSLEIIAGEVPGFQYNNIKPKTKIIYDSDADSWRISKKNEDYFKKIVSDEISGYTDKNGEFVFTTNCESEFLVGNRLVGYSNHDLSFYEFKYNDGELESTELTEEEVKALFPSYRIIKLSEFSPNTNAIKIKKRIGDLKILLLNDSGKTFEDYKYSSGNAVFKTYPMLGVLTVSKAGMIQFSKTGEDSMNHPWYVILVR